ncbi:hypothetical protein QLG12_24045 [Pseudomonas sp. V88_4]|uniref:hypothetical protein n=1 Tax=Pseudomonas sp. V88_4 TaxID=3044229 RepID=UPI00249DEA3B|nr:hypothetical protein [Pseudomonas sp. V88_4]MDI3401304.1 hypothetical protein [Pseudomonas sp. V88_4]
MSDSDNKLNIRYMPGGPISMIVSKGTKRNLLTGTIKSIDEELKTIEITSRTTNTPTIINFDSIENLILDTDFFCGAVIFKIFNTDEKSDSSMDDPVDEENNPPKQSQTPQRSILEGFEFPTLDELIPPQFEHFRPFEIHEFVKSGNFIDGPIILVAG